MPNIVLVNPRNDFASFKTFEVLSLGYLASFVESKGFDVSIYDCNFENPAPEAIASFCEAKEPVAIGFTSMVGSLRNVFQSASAIRRALRDVPIVCGGYSATFESEIILRDCPAIDFVIRGEGELSFYRWLQLVQSGSGSVHHSISAPPSSAGLIQLATAMDRPASYEDIPGLVFRESGTIRTIAGPILVDDLDKLPFPTRSQHLDRIALASILSSRGCSATCTFCSIQEFYRISSKGAIRCRSAKNVADEIESIHRVHGISRFLFIDDNFFMSERFSPGRMKAIAQELVMRGLRNIKFEVSSRSIDLKLPELEVLIEGGLDLVYLGLESGSASQLKRYRKGCNPERNAWAVREVRARGVRLDFGFIPFDPYLQPDELVDSFRFLLDQDLITPETVNTLTVTANLFPGTPLHEQAKADGLLKCTDSYYYWFSFKNEEMAPIYEQIIGYFKTRYVMNVVDAYANGFRQQGYLGPKMEVITRWLRRVCGLWIARAEAMLSRQSTDDLDDQIGKIEAFFANALNAHLILNRGLRETIALHSQVLGLEQVRKDAEDLDHFLEGEIIPGEWTEFFRVERRYRQSRSQALFAKSLSEKIILTPDQAVVIPCNSNSGFGILDVFVPPDIDIIPSGSLRPADMPPPMLYLGSVTGMPPIDCELLDAQGNMLQSLRLFKGWTEIPISASCPIDAIRLLSHVYLFQPVYVDLWSDGSVLTATAGSQCDARDAL